jgi:transposase
VQFDWGEMPTRPRIGGVERRVYALVASLPFSGAQTAHFSFDMMLESFLGGHVRVFDWLGGVPRECVYDNLRSVVAKRDKRQVVRWNQRFLPSTGGSCARVRSLVRDPRRRDGRRRPDRPAAAPRARSDHRGNAGLSYRSVLAFEVGSDDAELYRRPDHRRGRRRPSGGQTGVEGV